MKKRMFILIVFITVILVLSSTLSSIAGCKSKTSKQLDVYVWEGYVPEEVAALFEKETGIKLNISLISDNETTIALLQGGGKVDIVMPTDPHVNMYYGDGLVQPLNLDKITNYEKVSKSLREQPWAKWDGSQMGSGEVYAVPYVFGTSGLAINTAKYLKDLDDIGWEVLFDTDLKGKVSARNNYNSVLLILDLYGIPKKEFVTDTQGTLDKVRDKTINLKNNVIKFYDSFAEIIDLMKNEEVWVSYTPDGIGRQLEQFDSKFKYILPKTGGFVWSDTLMIPKEAANPVGANLFINFMLRPDIAAMVTDQGGYNTTIEGALEMTKNIDRDLYKYTDEEMANLQWNPPISEEVMVIFTTFWEELSTVQ